jgi:hypothetical protein
MASLIELPVRQRQSTTHRQLTGQGLDLDHNTGGKSAPVARRAVVRQVPGGCPFAPRLVGGVPKVRILPCPLGTYRLEARSSANALQPRAAMAVSQTFAFEIEHVQAMNEAFHAVCGKLELFAGTGDRASELVALKIIELANAGEKDADRLTARVLAEFGVENDGSLWRH